MPTLLHKIICQWDRQGKIEHTILYDGYIPPGKENNLLAISMPMLLSHQLGALRPSHGLIICSQVIDYYSKNKFMVYPINSALKNATIELFDPPEGTPMKFIPAHSLFANNDSLEEGVRQFLNNYIFYVGEKLEGDIKMIARAFAYATIDSYVKMINDAIFENKIGPKMDRWNLSFSTEMVKITYVDSAYFYFEIPDETTREKMEQKFQEKSLAINLSKAMRAMEITN